MKSLFNKKANVVLAAAIAATSASTVSADAYTARLTGLAINQLTSVQGVPGVDPTPNPALFQSPRLFAFGGGLPNTGWNTDMFIEIDATTGAVTDFELTSQDEIVFGSGGPQWDLRTPLRTFRPGPAFGGVQCSINAGAAIPNPIAALGGARPGVPGNADGNTLDINGDGLLAYHCTSTPNTDNFAIQNVPQGHRCGTPLPTSITPGDNGCGTQWGGAFGAAFINTPATDNGTFAPVSCVAANTTIAPSPLPVSLTGANPEVFCSGDPSQNFLSVGPHNFQGARSGGTIIVSHTGTLNDGTFSITAVEYIQDTDITFPIQGLPDGAAQSFTTFTFDNVVSQTGPVATSKNVPAMGAFGLAALFGGLIAVAARLRRRVS